MQSFIRTLLAFTVPGALPVKGYSRFGDGDEAGKRSRGSEHFQTLERGIYNNTTTSHTGLLLHALREWKSTRQ